MKIFMNFVLTKYYQSEETMCSEIGMAYNADEIMIHTVG